MYSQVEAKLKGNEKVKVGNLASGEYVSKQKFEDKVQELNTANTQIGTLNGEIKKFKEGDDPVKLKTDLQTLQSKYDADVVRVHKESVIREELMKNGAKHTDLLLNGIDLEKVVIDGKKVTGLSEQITSAKEKYKDLFEEKEAGAHYKPKDSTNPPEGDTGKSFADIIRENQVRK